MKLRERVGLLLMIVFSVGCLAHLLAPSGNAGIQERKTCRAIVKMEGIPTSMVDEVHGKIYSFEPEILNGAYEWPLEKKNNVIGADISLPEESVFLDNPFNLQTTFVAHTKNRHLKCSGEVNVLPAGQLKGPIVLYSTCEEAL
ncbi:MAG: hypothetical protein KCHDKBKB_01740 [Elusimicrobia bacterium]|nr:hypothetical protein [Elusimicrobiota bacterium]